MLGLTHDDPRVKATVLLSGPVSDASPALPLLAVRWDVGVLWGIWMALRTLCLIRLMGIATVALHHVVRVVCHGSELKMLELHTRRIIAAMTNDQAFRDGTVGLGPDQAMSCHCWPSTWIRPYPFWSK